MNLIFKVSIVLLLIGAVFSDIDTSVSIPENNNASPPLSTAQAVFQTYYNASVFPLSTQIITGFAFRQDKNSNQNGPSAEKSFPIYDIYLGPPSASVVANGLGNTFDANYLNSAPFKVKNTTYVIAANSWPGGNCGNACGYGAAITFDRPYTLNPNEGLVFTLRKQGANGDFDLPYIATSTNNDVRLCSAKRALYNMNTATAQGDDGCAMIKFISTTVEVTTEAVTTQDISTGITSGVTTGQTTGITTDVTTGITTGVTTGITSSQPVTSSAITSASATSTTGDEVSSASSIFVGLFLVIFALMF